MGINRTFYKTTMVVELLHDQPVPENCHSLEETLAWASENGSVDVKAEWVEHLDHASMASHLVAQRSDPDLFDGPVDGLLQSVLDLSTMHMPGTSPDWGGLRVAEHEYGAVVFVNGDVTHEQVAEMEPEWIRPAMALARSHGCLCINFDQAGEQCEDLPTWEW